MINTRDLVIPVTSCDPVTACDPVTSYISYINDVFSNKSIYKSLVVCHDHDVYSNLYSKLLDNDFPVSTINDMDKYVKDVSRMLIIDYVDYKNLEKIINEGDMMKINTIFFIGCKKSPRMDKFNNIDVKFYVID